MTVRILAVCGCGQGSSMIMKMKVDQFLKEQGKVPAVATDYSQYVTDRFVK